MRREQKSFNISPAKTDMKGIYMENVLFGELDLNGSKEMRSGRFLTWNGFYAAEHARFHLPHIFLRVEHLHRNQEDENYCSQKNLTPEISEKSKIVMSCYLSKWECTLSQV